MAEIPFSNRELNEKFTDIRETLAQILEQTKRTNGRISKLENWRAYVIGALSILTVLVLPIIFAVLSSGNINL